MSMIYSQLFRTPQVPPYSFAQQTVIITGANTGLGKEAARHISRLHAARVILAVRNTTAGEAARQDIIATTKIDASAISVWPLDLASYASVRAFASRAASELERIDVLLNNAGVALTNWSFAEGHETTVTVNVISTFLLTLLLLPKMRATATRYSVVPRVSIVSSEVHKLTKFTQRTEPDIFAALDDKTKSAMDDRYPLSKLLEVLAVRYGLGPALKNTAPKDGTVVVNYLNPGFCKTELSRDAKGLMALQFSVMKALLGRTAEVGSRTLVAAAAAGEESQGAYMTDGVVADDEVSEFVRSEEGERVGKKLWAELCAILEEIEPGVTKGVAGSGKQ